jgi:CheY-like chemotaxis protein
VREAAAFCLRGTAVACVIREPAAPPVVEIDEGQIGQVFSNLFINAAEAMPAGGQIEVEAEAVDIGASGSLPLPPGRYVRTIVTDHGAGIPPDVLPRIFDPYFTTKSRGSGLGLATVHSIVKRHGGHVEVRSEPLHGSSFTVYLPASAAPAPCAEAVTGGVAQSLDARVLVMDDEEPLRKVLVQILTGFGCDVHAVPDGDAALAAWSGALRTERPFDVAILDLTVRGGLGGEATMRRLQAIDPSAVAIVSSGYSDGPVLSRYADYGFAGAATKPYTIAELLRTLAQVLAARRER